MTREVTLAATQFACGWDIPANLDTAERLVREAAGRGAQIVLLQELFATPYFRITQDTRHFDLAGPAEGHPVIARFSRLAGELEVVLPVSFFERAGQAFFNSVAIIDADGEFLGVYRKSHIPDSGGYQEKYYFSPGDTGFRVWDTAYARIGVGICWDQWFPESARCMALQGAEVLLYPTAIGSDPPAPDDDSTRRVADWCSAATPSPTRCRWSPRTASGWSRRPAASRASASTARRSSPRRRAPCSPRRRATARRSSRRPSTSTRVRYQRQDWSFFRDRRPELYGPLLTLDGGSGPPGPE